MLDRLVDERRTTPRFTPATEDWRIEDNTLRPHSALDYLTPSDYAKA